MRATSFFTVVFTLCTAPGLNKFSSELAVLLAEGGVTLPLPALMAMIEVSEGAGGLRHV